MTTDRKEYYREYMRTYMRNYNTSMVECECGKSTKQPNIYRHRQTLKHLLAVGDYEQVKKMLGNV